MSIVLLVLGLGVFAYALYVAREFYGFQAKFTRGQVDARGQLVGPGAPAAIAWDQLVRIEIVTTDQGPFQEDVFWFFVNADGSACSIPGGEVDDGVMGRVSALPGVHFDAIIQAMGSCEDARFLVWSQAESVDAAASAEQAAGASSELPTAGC
ncbi:MAG TPA: hypothetical protein VFZ61_03180 [Polyangiales bacterium]